MVVESACVSSNSQLTETDNWAVSGHTKAEMGVAVVSVAAAVNKNDTRKMEIPPGRIILNELLKHLLLMLFYITSTPYLLIKLALFI